MVIASSSAVLMPDKAKGVIFEKQPGATWRDYLIMLLHIASEVEHALMVQYLFAAYSMGGKDVTPQTAPKVAKWQKSILNVAREEMGHLLTVQNILALLGAPPNFNRGETPFEAAMSHVPFVLDPLTKQIAASFTYAEMSHEAHLEETDPVAKAIAEDTLKLARSLGEKEITPHPVAKLYEEIVRVIKDEALIPDSDLDELSYEFQASWDDWGRGYAPDPKLLTPTGDVIQGQHLHHRASVIVMRAATRTDALDALHAISSQGEAVHLKHPHDLILEAEQELAKAGDEDEDEGVHDHEEPSHFERFFAIWKDYPDWKPYIDVVRNPATRPSTAKDHFLLPDGGARQWGLLFNIRYRMLLTFLSHSYRLSRTVRAGAPNLRGMVMHRAFGEMYNIKSIAGLMVQMKVGEKGGADLYAGPPFETPYSINMPASDADCWLLHRDLIIGARQLTQEILDRKESLGRPYLQTLRELDTQALAWVDGILSAYASRRRS